MLLLSSCFKGKNVDLIIHNAKIHSMDNELHVYEAMAIKDGKILELGPERQILNKYAADETIDAEGKEVYPGFTDAHTHILSLAKQRLTVDLSMCNSFEQLLSVLELYQQKNNKKIIIGRGWDQASWGEKEMPSNKELNLLFPETPVCLVRVDGHALLANEAMLKLAKVDKSTKIDGGIVELKNDSLTGILVDNAMNPVYNALPIVKHEELIPVIKEIEVDLYSYGITNIHEAGIEFEDIALFENLIKNHDFKLNVYAMLMPSQANKEFARKNGRYKKKNLLINSFKLIGDGALGSRGAFLKYPYSDAPHQHGVLTTTVEEMKSLADFCVSTNYQMNAHAIGDSTNRILLEIYERAYKHNPDHRWRIEHAQVIDLKDFELFSKFGVIPSVQPTHAVSDQRWAEERLGKERIKGAYAYKRLLETCGILALGTDFPVENMDPFMTIYAATKRKNKDGVPGNGFYLEQALTLDECLKGMTFWAALASFQEDNLGSLEKGKDATFVVFDSPIREYESYTPNYARFTFVLGKKVFDSEN